ncbi:MAG: signal peptidase I [Thermoanaerobaculia bacterium]|nr:signal peptidase I [Thermoanaerobaculia bacterium]
MVAHAAPAALSRSRGVAAPLARALLVGALVALFARAFVAAAAVVPTGSMTPALAAGDRVLVDRLVYAADLPAALAALLPARPPRVGDVVWLRSPHAADGALVKRVAALAGQPFAGGTVPPGHLAVLGDRRADSLDSRAFGPVPAAAAAGRVCLVLWSAGDDEGLRRGRLLRVVR